MNTDIRLIIGFFDHKKTQRLRNILGYEGVECLIRLWMDVAQNRPEGELTGWDADDIEIAAHWNGEKNKFFNTIISEKCRWVDNINGVYCVHDWGEHQPYAIHAKDRSEHARQAASARWINKTQCSEHARSMLGAMLDCNLSNAPSPAPAPAPAPAPLPKEETDKDKDKDIIVPFSEKPKTERVLKFDEDDMRMAVLLSDMMTENNPTRKPTSPKQLESWANESRLMRKQNNRTLADIEAHIRFAQNDNFWKTNAESMSKIRDKYDAFTLLMEQKQSSRYRNDRSTRIHTSDGEPWPDDTNR